MNLKNINKKLVAGGLILTLVTTPLAGCSIINGLEYEVDDQGQYQLTNEINYDTLKECYFVIIDNLDYDKTEYYITAKERIAASDHYQYCNLLNGKKVFERNQYTNNGIITENSNRTLINEIKVEECLISCNNIKASYTKEDIEEILKQMIDVYGSQNNKKLVKE